jgi:hypothetical protein
VYECDHESSTKRGLGPVGLLRHDTISTPAINALLDKSEGSKLVIPKSAVGQNLNMFYPPSSFKIDSNNINLNASTLPSRSTKLPNSKRFPTTTTKTKSRTTSLNAHSKGRSQAQTHQMAGRILAGSEVYHKLLNSKGINSTSQQLTTMFLIPSGVVSLFV